MIFIVLLVIVFGMVVSTMQFGSMPDGGSVTAATPRAQVYAVNMETWHQAAMLTLSLDSTPIKNDPNCNAAGPTACDLNKYMRDPTTFALITDKNISPLAQNWPEYVPVVAEGDPTKINSGGWQSFLIKNIDGTCADPANVNCPANGAGTENYVLTVFRGYGYGGNYTNSKISSNTGSMNNAQIATALAKTVQDRMGVGNLQCTATVCSFTRAAAYTPPGGGAKSDLPLQFPLSVFTSGAQPLQGSVLPAAGTQPLNQVFDPPNNSGLPAIMTRVGDGSALPPPPGNCPAEGYEFNTTGGQWKNPTVPVTVGTLDSGYFCFVNFPSKTAPTPAVPSNGNGAATGYTLGAGTATADCLVIGGNPSWQTGTPASLPTCNAPVTPPSNPPPSCSCSIGGSGGCTVSCSGGGSGTCTFSGGSGNGTCYYPGGGVATCNCGV